MSESEAREKYRIHDEKKMRMLPLFAQAGWWDAVCGKDGWSVSMVFSNDRMIASLPYAINRKWGFHRLLMPPLTHRTVLWLDYPKELKNHTKISLEIESIGQLIAQFPSTDYIELNLDFSLTNGLAFHYAGYRVQTRYCYALEGLDDLEKVYQNLKSSTRKGINPQKRAFEIEESDDVSAFFKLNQMSFSRQKFESPYDENVFLRIDDYLKAINRRKIFFAVKDGVKIGAFYLAWDEERSYAIMTGIHPDYLSLNAMDYLTWHVIEFTGTTLKLKMYDMVGSMHPTIEPARRKWGATLYPYLNVSKMNSRLLKLYYHWRS